MNKLLRVIGTAIAVLIAVRLVSWLLSPALPVLIEIGAFGLVIYVAVNGWRRL